MVACSSRPRGKGLTMASPRNILVTGGAGFIGSNAVRHMLGNCSAWRMGYVDAETLKTTFSDLDCEYANYVKGLCQVPPARAGGECTS